jgi:hypothetical protein
MEKNVYENFCDKFIGGCSNPLITKAEPMKAEQLEESMTPTLWQYQHSASGYKLTTD